MNFARAHLGLALTLSALLALASDCALDQSAEACERLRHLSCDCFEICQAADHDAIKSADGAVCEARIAELYGYWGICASGERANGHRCDSGCLLGWGECAFDVYARTGRAPQNVCIPAAVDGGGG